MTKLTNIENHYSRFGRNMVAGLPALTHKRPGFSGIWQKMAANQMFGLCLPKAFGGQGGNLKDLAGAASALVSAGGDIGIAMSWLIHEIISCRLIHAFGDGRQKKEMLPDLAAGKMTVSLAVSEPDIGAHPKYLQTEASCESGIWTLTGQKTYITNGPISERFIVMAKTGVTDGKNRYTAFLVHKDTPGLHIHDPMDLPFLKSCPHGGISLENCQINEAPILGPKDDAYESMAVPFRNIEDVLLMSLVSGGLNFEIDRLGQTIGHHQDLHENKDILFKLGHLKCQTDGMNALADRTAEIFLENEKDMRLSSLPSFLRSQAKEFQRQIKELTADLAGFADLAELPIARDIDGLLTIGRQAAQNRMIKMGEKFASDVKQEPKSGRRST
ncbi:MAG: acyl-CoA dehydrogenase family protein [Desulfobacterales bacterium]|nr:acyl-CoA dehydrogenase family protein [Desulfobacterales bacterium]